MSDPAPAPTAPVVHHDPGPPPRPTRLRSLRVLAAAASAWVAEATSVQKWLVLGVAVGVIAGSGAVAFYAALQLSTHLFLAVLAGYRVPTPFGEGNVVGNAPAAREWALPLVTGLGALLGAILVFGFAPDAEGHGTDAAISAVHHNPRGVRLRTVVVKIVASALTIGSGGSGGREGPTGQISAGFGSLLARVLDLNPADARIVVATGIGSGIGSIFGAPLGGAVLAAEILYRDDFEPAALLPSFIASGVGYGIFGAVEGFTPLFGFASFHFTHPLTLVFFAVIGIAGGLIGLLYAKGFYGLTGLFGRSPLPRWANPALAGVLVGAIGIAIPQVIGTGYGWIQHGLGRELLELPLWIVIAVPFARILATGLSIGSGGAGGIFGPGMVIGAFVGAAAWRLLEPIFPGMGADPAPYVIAGMMCCFGSVARAPVAVTIMVAEMTGSLSALEPGMVAVGVAWLIVTRTDQTMYRAQLRSRADRPGRQTLDATALPDTPTVADAMARPRLLIPDVLTGAEALTRLREAGLRAAPVVDADGRFEGTTGTAVLTGRPEDGSLREAIDAGAPTVSASATLVEAMDALSATAHRFLPVLDADRQVIGTLSVGDILGTYRSELRTHLGDRPGGEPSGPVAEGALREPGRSAGPRRTDRRT